MPDPLSAARELLPVGLPCVASLAYPLFGAGLTLICGVMSTWLAGWAFRAERPEHWVERARLGWSPRRLAAAWAWVGPMAAALLALRLDNGLCPIPPWVVAAACFGLGWLLMLPVRAHTERRYGPSPVGALALARSAATLGLVLYPHLLLWLVLAMCMPAGWGVATWLLTALALVLGVLAFLGGGLRVGQLFGLVRKAPAELADLAEAAGERVGVAPRAAWVLEVRASNAFAFPWSGDVGFTRRALQTLDPAQISAILAHELGHLAEPRRVRALRASGTLALVPLLLIRPLSASFGLAAPVLVFAGVVLLTTLVRRVRRAMEVRADEVAHEHEEDPGVYARALESIYRTNGVPPVLSKRGTHPALYDRMVAAGVEPDYPRPDAPRSTRLAVLPAACLLVFAWTAVLSAPSLLGTLLVDDRAWAWQEIAATGGNADVLGLLADVAFEEDDLEAAAVFGRAAVTLAPSEPWHRAGLAWSLATGGDCVAARQELAVGHELLPGFAPNDSCGAADRLKSAREIVLLCEAGQR
jgi:Zn-dependent protease with chaperone function